MDRHPGALIGLVVGIALGFAGAFGGFSAFVIVLVLGAIGVVVGLVLDGTLDITGVLGDRRRDRLDSVTTVVPAVPIGTAATVEPGERGRTLIADRVVAKVAAQAAVEVQSAAGLRRSLAGRSLGQPRVRSSADVDGHVASVTLDLAVDYPAPVRQVTREVRRQVTEKVGTLCGMQVDHVDITVAALRRPPVEQRRVL